MAGLRIHPNSNKGFSHFVTANLNSNQKIKSLFCPNPLPNESYPVSSIFHFKEIEITALKEYLSKKNKHVRILKGDIYHTPF